MTKTTSDAESIPFGHLHSPKPAQEEVTAALENGEYETTDDLVLSQVINVDESYLMSSHTDGELPHYYAVEVEEEGNRTRLRLKKTRPPLNQTIPLRGSIDDTVMVDVVITYEPENETLINKTFELSPDDEIELGDDKGWRYGNYHLAITARTDDAEASLERTLTLDHRSIYYGIDIHSGSENTSLGVGIDEGYGALPGCSWDSDGNLDNQRG